MLEQPMKPDSKLASMFCFLKNQSGAAMIEYSILIGLISGAAITIVFAVGGWVNDQWENLETVLNLS